MCTPPSAPPSRRAVLAGTAAVVGSPLLSTGCGLFPRKAIELSTAPLRLLGSAIAQAQLVLAAVHDGEHLATLRNNHRDHLKALRRRIGGAAFSEGDPTPGAPGGEQQLVDTERALWETARQRVVALPELRDGLDPPRHTDQISLLGSIAACQATHLVLLNTSAPEQEWQPPTGSQRSVTALQAVLANEHAVIYGYGALGGHLPAEQRNQALAALERHTARRDALSIAINAYGSRAAQSAVSYKLPRRIDTSEQARELAITLEESCTGHWRAVLAAAERRDRSAALASLTDCATTATRWRLLAGARPAAVPFPSL